MVFFINIPSSRLSGEKQIISFLHLGNTAHNTGFCIDDSIVSISQSDTKFRWQHKGKVSISEAEMSLLELKGLDLISSPHPQDPSSYGERDPPSLGKGTPPPTHSPGSRDPIKHPTRPLTLSPAHARGASFTNNKYGLEQSFDTDSVSCAQITFL